MSAPEMDDAIRHLAHEAALAAIENTADLCIGQDERRLAALIMARRHESAAFIAELVMETADETEGSAVHAVRSFAR